MHWTEFGHATPWRMKGRRLALLPVGMLAALVLAGAASAAPTPTPKRALVQARGAMVAIARHTGAHPHSRSLDVANLYTSWYSTVAPQRLAGMTWTQIIRSLKRPRSAAAQAVAGEAEVVTAELCSVTHGRPQSVCSPALVAQYRQGLPGMDGRGGGCPAYRALARRRGRLPVAGAARCHI